MGSRPQPRLLIIGIFLILLLAAPALAASTQLRVARYAVDGITVLNETTVTYQWMRDNLPVMGDGVTHYYHQGPVFVDDPDEATEQSLRWNPEEDTNVEEKDMGAVKGTNVKDLCNLAGGLTEGETLEVKATDGFTKTFAYRNVYEYTSREGPIVVTWYCTDSTFSTCPGPYPDSSPGYADGMRLVWFADDSTNPWGIHAFGNYDWHEAADQEYWYYYVSGGENYPTTTGLSVKYVSEIRLMTDDEAVGDLQVTSTPPGAAILADDSDTGVLTNSTLSGLDLGPYTVKVALDGYRDTEEQVTEVRWGIPASLHFTLARMEGSVAVTSTPPGAAVYLDGTDTRNVTPCTLTGLVPGDHTVTVKLSGYTDTSDAVTVEDGETAELDLELIALEPDSEPDSSAGETSSSLESGGSLVTVVQGQVTGGVLFATTTGGPWTLEHGTAKTSVLQPDLPSNATVVKARLLVFTDEEPSAAGAVTGQADPIITVGDRTISPVAAYRDCRPGRSSCPVIRTLVFDLAGRLSPGGEIPIGVKHPGGQAGPMTWYGAALVVVYERESGNETRYWISEGADGILMDRDSPLPESETRTLADFPGEVSRNLVEEAVLLPISTVPEGGEGEGHLLTFNGNEWITPLSGDGVWSARMDVRPYLRSGGNEVTMESAGVSGRGDLLENRAAILVVTYGNGTAGEEPAGTESPGVTMSDTTQPEVSLPSPMPVPIENATFPREPPACLNLTVTSSPDRALVSLDGTYLSKVTPVTLTCVARGVHEVKLERDDFRERVVTLDLQDDTSIHEDLSSVFPQYASLLKEYSERINVTADRCGGVYVSSYPEKASILLDGKDTGQLTNAVISGLKPGLHTIRIRSDKAQLADNTRQVWVYPSVISMVHFKTYPPVKREVTVESQDLRKAEFTVNGRYPSFKIPRKVTLPSWESFITVRDNGAFLSYPAWSVDHNGTLQVRRQDTPGLTTLRVLSDPRGADIQVDGFQTGLTTPSLVRNLSAGTHRILVFAPGYLPKEQLVTQLDMPGEGPDNVLEFFLESTAYGSLEVTSTPPGARIFIFQRDTGEKTPHVFSYLDIGTYDVKVEGEADSRIIYGLTVTPYGLTSRHVNLSVI